MKIILLSVGTRGDMEPFLAIGEILKEKGEDVICAFPEQFRDLAENSSMEFYSLGTKFIDLLESNDGKAIYPIIWELNNWGKTILITKKWLKLTDRITRKQIKNALLSNKAIYTISPSLFPRPDYWNENIKILGYHRLNKALNWQPDKLIYFVDHIPYDWILPKIYGIIHHGGSGTTHLGLRYGCATIIIPHIIDQFVWNKMISVMGAGPKGMNIHKITTKNLESKIPEMVNNDSFKKKAENIANQMEQEDFREELYTSIVN